MNLRLAAVIGLSQMCLACVNVVSVDVEDDVSFVDFEASAPLDDSGATRIRVRSTQVDGDFDQTLDAGEAILVDNNILFGPTEVTGEMDINYWSLAIGQDDRSQAGVAGTMRPVYYFGVSQTRWDLDVNRAARGFSTSDETTEIYFQYGFLYTFRPSLELGFSWATSIGQDVSGINEIDLKMNYAPLENLGVTAGYRWFDYEYGLGAEESHLEVDFRGPYLGLSLQL